MGTFDIAKIDKKSDDFDWRLLLKKGDIIDVSDQQNIWYNSTVLETRTHSTNSEVTEAKIAYRTYNSEGTKIDD